MAFEGIPDLNFLFFDLEDEAFTEFLDNWIVQDMTSKVIVDIKYALSFDISLGQKLIVTDTFTDLLQNLTA